MNNEAIHNTDADAVRALLEKWYDGSATAADEQRLIDCFCATPTADIPADLRPDAQIFRAMGSVPAVAAEAPAVPKRAPRANVRTPKPTDYGYREADAEEAARILSHSLDKVDQVVRSGSDRAVADVARHINNATTLLNLSVANVSVSTDNSIRKTEFILKTINLLQDENN